MGEMMDMTVMVKNRLRLEFDRIGERELDLLAKLYVVSATMAAVRPGPISKYLFGFAHDYLCVDGRHERLEQFEQALLTDLGTMLADKIASGIESGEITPVKGDPKEKLTFAEALQAAISGKGTINVQMMTLEEAKANGMVPPDFEPRKPRKRKK